MEKAPNVKIVANNCEVTESMRLSITNELIAEVKRFPECSLIHLTISKLHNRHWTLNLSMRYSRGHVAVTKNAFTFESALRGGISEFKKDLRIHEIQWTSETFHFNKFTEYDLFTEIRNAALPLSQKKIKVLVLEDDPAASLILKATLESYGCHVDHIDLPSGGLKAINENPYDLLILDWNLPFMKGGEFLAAADLLLEQTQKNGIPQKRIPVVICTSMPMESIRIPETDHFFVINYWHKSLPFSSILSAMDATTKKVSAHHQMNDIL